MINNKKYLTEENSTKARLNLADNSSIEVLSKGNAKLNIMNDEGTKSIKLHDVLYAPNLGVNLLSVSKITDKGNTVIFENDRAEIINKKGKKILEVNRKGNIYSRKSK